ncbi:MAG: 30S ribosomal protein S5 [bacterium]
MLKNESQKSKEVKDLREKELKDEAGNIRKIDIANKSKDKKFKKVEEKEFEQKIIDLARVTRVMAGGKRMRFRATVIMGDKKGKVGFGVAKGADVSMAVNKAALKAKKKMITVRIVNGTIPYEVRKKFKASKILIKPASKGTGIIAGGAVRNVLEIAGVSDVVAKILGSPNKVNNVVCAIRALEDLDLVKKTQKHENTKTIKQ